MPLLIGRGGEGAGGDTVSTSALLSSTAAIGLESSDGADKKARMSRVFLVGFHAKMQGGAPVPVYGLRSVIPVPVVFR